MEFSDFVTSGRLEPAQVNQLRRHIYDSALAGSRYLGTGNFKLIHPEDLESLFEAYDACVFDGHCRHALGSRRIRFRLSRRMTRAGAMTVRYEPRTEEGQEWFEIVVSTTLLFQTFWEESRPVTVTGIPCQDRLEALMRLFEHELVHLVELLVWQDSSCSRKRFQSIASRFFGHKEHSHQLITPDERAWESFGIRRGSRVFFDFEGKRHQGVVNRITRRATVLVESRNGVRYSDGRRYAKFYVPVEQLHPVDEPAILRGQR